MRTNFILSVSALAVLSTAHAQERKFPNSYPTKPYETSLIEEKIKRLTETDDFIWDAFEIESKGLTKAKTRNQPWSGYFWAINQGGIANQYRKSSFISVLDPNKKNWKKNVQEYKEFREKVHPKIYTLDEDDLADLSPAEKYDLLLGDTSFDLTNRIWDYTEKWGQNNKYSFVTDIEVPQNYVFKPLTDPKIAPWEGFCHGWAVAAGIAPRPLKTVEVLLPNGKKLKFYPTDIKALLTLMWANSSVQSSVIFEGTRCNSQKPIKDEHGRYVEPECADVHPGVFHSAIVNIVGVQGRSMIVDKSAGFSIANQPVAGYEFVYYNPDTTKTGSLMASMVSAKEYAASKKDRFAASRNKDATHIVGVSMKLRYIDWENPKKGKTNDDDDDGFGEMKFNYDLELNKHGEIVGGQWRVERDGDDGGMFGNSTGQPDFFWVAPKNWKTHFTGLQLPEWNFNRSQTPPREYALAARGAHSFVFEESEKYQGVSPKCPLTPAADPKGKQLWVDCTFRTPQPQPLIQVVNKLLELSRR